MFQIDLNLDHDGHEFRTVSFSEATWRELLADRYVTLRSIANSPIDPEIFEGLSFDTAHVAECAQRSGIPKRVGGKLCIVRSDFGEMLGVVLCESHYGTRFGWLGIRDRALNQQPGGGLDSVGVEGDVSSLKVVLLEVKVSTEMRAGKPPQVVDQSHDGLRKQHLKHIKHRADETVTKVIRAARSAQDSATATLLSIAAFLLENPTAGPVQIVCVSVLVRPRIKFNEIDFGSFRASPADFVPAQLRFVVSLVADDLEQEVDDWYAQVLSKAGGG